MDLLEQYIEELYDAKGCRLERYRRLEHVDPVRAEAAKLILLDRFYAAVAAAEEA